ncbi:MAG: hypothetical protein ABI885_14875 [Gammaproteobacteria bacterium]
MIGWSKRYRAIAYLLLNVVLLLAVVLSAVAQNAPPGLTLYVCGLLVLCTAPIVFLDSINGRYALLAIFMGLYFLFFGMVDLLSLWFSDGFPAGQPGSMSAAEEGILLGAALALGGYLLGAKLGGDAPRTGTTDITTDWPRTTILMVGLALWICGTAAVIYFQVFAAPDKTNLSVKHGLESMGPLLTFVVMLGSLLQPLGLLILAYGYAKSRTFFWQALIVAIVLAQVVVGFITDIKAIAFLGGLLVIITKTLLDNRLPRVWLASGVIFLVIAFPIFQAYRHEVAGERGLNRTQALQNLTKVFKIAVQSRDKVTNGHQSERAQTFFERLSGKQNVAMIFEHVGVDTPLLGGNTLVAIPLAFVPRLILPDKPDVPVGQLYNKVFLKGDSDVSISVSHVGELYWNFGWGGVLVGLPLTGLLLGFIGSRCDLSRSSSVTRLLVLVATAQCLCMGFGGSIAMSYVIWLRSLGAIGILHLLLARRSGPQQPRARSEHRDTGMAEAFAPVALARFPNVLS